MLHVELTSRLEGGLMKTKEAVHPRIARTPLSPALGTKTIAKQTAAGERGGATIPETM
jgi:hypothetical protein